MNGKEYMQTQITIIEIGKRASLLDLDAFLQAISNAEAVGPVVDPTLYRKAMNNLSAVRELAKAVKTVKEAHENVVKTVLETAAKT